MRFLHCFLVILTTLMPLAGAIAVDLDSPHREGVVMFSVWPGYKIELPSEGDLRSGYEPLDRFMDGIGATLVERTFPFCLPPVKDGPDLSLIYNLYFPESVSIADVIHDLSKVEGIELVEPWYIYQTCFEPNDPRRGQQYALQKLQMYSAWDIHRGSRSIVVADVDTGIQYNHPDIAANLWINPGEDLNGNGVIDQDEINNRDDDGNGYRDDFWGWDAMQNDRLPQDSDGHGTHTGGTIAAVTNNGTGVASIGFNISLMVYRAGTGGSIQYGYQGIEYAARNGATAVNCSWGGPGGNDFTRRVVIDANARGCLVVAAAGNDNVDATFYPASYPTVLAVAATDQNDRRAGFSNYGAWVDVSAPGVSIMSTVPTNGYASYQGTSMAAPHVAGLAGLVKSAYEQLTVEELRQLILAGADNIDEQNPNFQGRLGSGRVNAYRSLLLGNRPILTIDTLIIDDSDEGNGNGALDPGESVRLLLTISNGANGQPTEGIQVIALSSDTTIFIAPEPMNFPDLEPGEQVEYRDGYILLNVNESARAHTTWITVVVTAAPGDVRIEREFELLVGHPDILVIDDDEGGNAEETIFESIEAMGLGWARWDVVTKFSPDAVTLEDYPMVVWITGDANPPLDELDRFQLETALYERANIMLIGKRIGDDAENHELLRNYFGAMHREDSAFAIITTGLVGERPVAPDIQLVMSGGGGSDPRISPSTMAPVLGADSLMVYRRAGMEITGLAGVWREDRRTQSRTIYLGFSFESVSNRQSARDEAFRQMFRWFRDGELNNSAPYDPSLPMNYAIEPAFPNPFNSRVRLGYTLPAAARVELAIYDPSGRLVEQLYSGMKASGRHAIQWDANLSPSGIYFFRLTTPGRAPIEERLVLVR
ncbi:MAG: T9SS type A sorting domain-containing protein [Calditrichaeota bacterium]|nr:T9SS type A sorting domain-containing protein [Calditrichota bacterium]